jgi:hypothetical protein
VWLSVALFSAGCPRGASRGITVGGNDLGAVDLSSPAGDGSSAQLPSISPQDAVVVVSSSQPQPTLQFVLTLNGQSLPATSWGINRAELGTIDANGLFSTQGQGKIAGRASIDAVYGGQKYSTWVTVQVVVAQNGDPAYVSPPAPVGAGGYGGVGGDGPAPPATAAQQTTLNGTPTADASVKLLYPYDGTVWPRGLLAPLIQWSPGAHQFDSVYVHIKELNYEYQGYFKANASNFVNLPLPQAIWNQLTLSNAGEDVAVSLTLGEGATAYGPYSEKWKIAPATLKGTIYYNSYDTALSGGVGGTLAIKASATAPSLVTAHGTCMVCHSVSANGSALMTQTIEGNNNNPAIYLNLLNDTTKGSGTTLSAQFGVPAMYPDASMMLSNAGTPFGTDTQSRLYSLPSGQVMSGVTGLPGFFAAGLPVFSPDGLHLAFVFMGGAFNNGPQSDGVSLVELDFDTASKTFSKPRTLYSPMQSPQSATYSSFLPSGAGVVFELQLSSSSQYPWGHTDGGNTGELWWVDVATQKAHRLDALNGTNLPINGAHPQGLDSQINYEPTVNPIASGGYAWVVFTSRRLYGNVLAGDPWSASPATNKKLWVAAFDLNAAPGADPSHPAFYLPAQEIAAGNSRGYWSVDPCHGDGLTCQTGDECCGGYCAPSADGLACTSTAPACSAEFDKCNTTADCCGASIGMVCLNHLCTQGQPLS